MAAGAVQAAARRGWGILRLCGAGLKRGGSARGNSTLVRKKQASGQIRAEDFRRNAPPAGTLCAATGQLPLVKSPCMETSRALPLPFLYRIPALATICPPGVFCGQGERADGMRKLSDRIFYGEEYGCRRK